MKKLTLALVALSAFDIVITMAFVNAGISTEFNPILAVVLTWPLPAIFAYKLALPVLVGLFLFCLDRSPAAGAVQPRGALRLLVISMTLICIFNLSALFF